MLLPIKSKNPPESLPVVTCVLIAMNVIVYACTSDGFMIHKDALDKLALTGNNVSFLTLMNFQRAIATYQEVINRYPMTPLADQARIRVKALSGNVKI